MTTFKDMDFLRKPATIAFVTIFTAAFMLFFCWMPMIDSPFEGAWLEFSKYHVWLCFLITVLYAFCLDWVIKKGSYQEAYVLSLACLMVGFVPALSFMIGTNSRTEESLFPFFVFGWLCLFLLIMSGLFVVLLRLLYPLNRKVYYSFSVLSGGVLELVSMILFLCSMRVGD